MDSLFAFDFGVDLNQWKPQHIPWEIKTQARVPFLRVDPEDEVETEGEIRKKKKRKTEDDDDDEDDSSFEMFLPYGTRREDLVESQGKGQEDGDGDDEQHVETFRSLLKESIRKRLEDVPNPLPKDPSFQRGGESRISILYSGGIDSLLIALLAHRLLPPSESIEFDQ